MTPWLNIVGIGEYGLNGLALSARKSIEQADYIVGGKRHHALVPLGNAKRIQWPSPFDALITKLQSLRGQRVVVLATGDPLWFSVGNRIAKEFNRDEVVFHSHVSAFQLAAGQMGWAIQNVDCLTVHGRPIDRIQPYLQDDRQLLLLTSNGEEIFSIAQKLVGMGFGQSRLVALANLGGENFQRFEGIAKDWPHDVPSLNTLAIHCAASADAKIMGQYGGLPDNAFVHDGTMTKQDIRATTLAKLMPMPNALLWDVGCGCGSVAIEWMRSARGARAIGIEAREDRRKMALENARCLGGFDLPMVAGRAPDALKGLETPDAIFVGGGLSAEVFDFCLATLKPMGRLVCNSVTLGSEQVLLEKYAAHGGALTKLQIAQAVPVGEKMGWKPAMPVTQYSLVKK